MKASHQRFIAAYLKDPNGKRAAIKAGFAPRSAEVTASRLLRNDKVARAVQAGLQKVTDDAMVSRERVLRALLNIAELDPLDVFNHDGTLKDLKDIPTKARLAISAVETDDLNASLKKIRFWSKTDALGILAKTVKGLIVSQHELSGRGGAPLIPPAQPIDFSKIPTRALLEAINRYPGNGDQHDLRGT